MPTSKKAKLILEDGTEFNGFSFGYDKSIAGEVVFYTAMTGYPESLTDPSYAGQILVSTYPMIGNYGVPGSDRKSGIYEYYESDKIQISGLIISDYSKKYSHWNAMQSLGSWLKEQKVPGVYGIDTRALTKILREKGSMLGKIVIDKNVEFYDPNSQNLVDLVSIKQKETYGNGKYKVLLVDCGVKNNIIRCLLERDATVTRVPWDYDFSNEIYNGIFLTNGPGDPEMCNKTIENIKKVLDKDQPIMGICLGNQLLAKAAGASTYKMKYGHRSHNQPVKKIGTERCYITSQNHGYAVDGSTLPNEWETLFENVNDNSNEGIKHRTKPFFSTQFHPEASSGPTDTEYLFDEFISNIKTFLHE